MNIASLPVCTEGHSNVTTVPPIRAPYGSTPLVVSRVTSPSSHAWLRYAPHTYEITGEVTCETTCGVEPTTLSLGVR